MQLQKFLRTGPGVLKKKLTDAVTVRNLASVAFSVVNHQIANFQVYLRMVPIDWAVLVVRRWPKYGIVFGKAFYFVGRAFFFLFTQRRARGLFCGRSWLIEFEDCSREGGEKDSHFLSNFEDVKFRPHLLSVFTSSRIRESTEQRLIKRTNFSFRLFWGYLRMYSAGEDLKASTMERVDSERKEKADGKFSTCKTFFFQPLKVKRVQ